MMALQALSEYALSKSIRPETNVVVEFSVLGRNDIVSLSLKNEREKVEANLKVSQYLLSNTHRSSFLFCLLN